MRPLRFCHFTTFYPPFHFGGDGIGVQRLCRALARRGHHVTVVHDVDAYEMQAARGATNPEPETDPYGVEVIPMRSGLGALSCLMTHQTGRPVANAKRIRRILDAGRFDVLNYHNVSLVGGPGLLAMGDAVKLYTAHEHWLVCESHTLWRHGRERCDARECVRCVLRNRRPPQPWRRAGTLERHGRDVDAWIAVSEFSRGAHRDFGFPFEMEVLPYFLPDAAASSELEPRDPARSPHARPYFLFAGRLEKLKGLQDVIPLFRERRGADLLICGAGSYEGELRRLARGMEHVRFLGRMEDEALARAYRHAEALVVPSLCYETFGIVLLEAFAQGTPVLARRVGPFPEIVASAGGGELFETERELLDAMQRMLADSAHRERMGASAREALASRWTESAVLPRYLDVVRRAARRRGAGDVVHALAAGERPQRALGRVRTSEV